VSLQAALSKLEASGKMFCRKFRLQSPADVKEALMGPCEIAALNEMQTSVGGCLSRYDLVVGLKLSPCNVLHGNACAACMQRRNVEQ
jgi:hypothetical protein